MTWLIPKYKDIQPNKDFDVGMGVQGEFRIVLRDLMGRKLQDTGYFRNLITNCGMDAWGSNVNPCGMNQGWVYWVIGDNATPASYTDQFLYNQLSYASDFTGIDAYEIYNNDDPIGEYGWGTIEHKRFNAGQGTGTIREVGIASGSSGIIQGLYCRQVVPTPIVKGPDNILDLYWKIRVYMDLTDATGTTNIEGSDYNYIVRPVYTTGNADNFTRFIAASPLSGDKGYYGTAGTTFEGNFAFPSGTKESNYALATTDLNDYVAGSHQNNMKFTIGVDGVTSDNTIRAFFFKTFNGRAYCKVYFDKVVGGGGVFKDNERTFECNTTISWSRRAGS